MFFDQSTSLCAETVASRARIELARLQREDIEARQKESENYRKRLSGAKPVGKNEDEIRPESPTSEKKNVIKRRGASYRIPLYTNDAGVRAKEMEAKGDTNKEQKDIELVRLLLNSCLSLYYRGNFFIQSAYFTLWDGSITTSH